MSDVLSIIKSNDIDKVEFHLEYTEIVIDFFEKRNLDITELTVELNLLQEKYEELKKKRKILQQKK